MAKRSLSTYPKRFFKSDKPFKSYDRISIYMSVLRNSVQYLKSACILFLYSLDCALITLLILERITVSVEKGTSGYLGSTSSIYLNWNISVFYCQIDIKLILLKAEWRWLLFRNNHFSMSLPVSQTWRHYTLNCEYLS